MVDVSRVQKELTECNRDKEVSGVSIALHDGGTNISHLTGTIVGPVGTPYEGGTFLIDIRLPGGYPFEPPKMQFITKVWHPNISSQNGAICLDILKDQWSPALTLKTALLSLQALLSAPAPDDPQDAVVAQQLMLDDKLGCEVVLISSASFSAFNIISSYVLRAIDATQKGEKQSTRCFESALQYLRDYSTFIGTARYWTEAFAKSTSTGMEEKVQKLVEMGFPEDLVRSALKSVNGDENMALEKLCSG